MEGDRGVIQQGANHFGDVVMEKGIEGEYQHGAKKKIDCLLPIRRIGMEDCVDERLKLVLCGRGYETLEEIGYRDDGHWAGMELAMNQMNREQLSTTLWRAAEEPRVHSQWPSRLSE